MTATLVLLQFIKSSTLSACICYHCCCTLCPHPCRCQYIKPDLLNSVLQGIADKTAKPFTGHFQQLSGLLAYLNLPGDIRDYLPPLATLSIKHSTVLTFCHNCDDLLYQYRMKHAAEEAVDKMLSFKPFGKVSMTSGDAARILRDNGSRFAVFAIALSKRHGLGVPLKVYLVHGIHDYVTRQQETPADLYKQYLDSLKAGVSSGWRQPVTMTLRQRHDKVAPSCAEVLHSGGLGPCNDLNAVLADMKLVGPKKQHGFWESFPPSYDELIGHTKRAFIMHTAGTTLSAFELLLQLYKGGVVEWEYPLWLLGW